MAYGISNAISSFFQCYPNASSMSRSAIQEGSGGKTVLVGGISSIILGTVIIALAPLFQSLPMACLSAIVIVNLKGLFLQLKDFYFYFQISLLECVSRRKTKYNNSLYSMKGCMDDNIRFHCFI